MLVIQAINIVCQHLHQVKRCFHNLQAFQDTIVIILATTTCAMYAYRYVKLTYLISEFNRTPNNDYFNMEEIIVVEYWSMITTALWCSQNMIHLIDIGSFNSHIRIFYYTILYAMHYIVICIVLSSIFLISFSTAFHFIIGQENYLFHSFILAYVEVFAIPFNGHPNLEITYTTWPNLVPYFLFSFYGYTYRFLVNAMFAVVLVNSYHRARIRTYLQVFKYTVFHYIKERVLKGKNKFDMDRMLPKRKLPKDPNPCFDEKPPEEIVVEEESSTKEEEEEEEDEISESDKEKDVVPLPPPAAIQ